MIFWTQVIKVATALYIITDALGNLPFYMVLTEGASKEERGRITLTAIVTGLILLSFFAFAGNLFFDLFDLSIEDLRIAGGVLLLIISVEVLMRGRIMAERRDEVGVVPLGSPLLVGPGAITSVLVMLRIYQLPAVILGTLICFVFVWLTLHFGEHIYRVIGRNGSLIITKIAAILIAAIAVRFIRQGITVIFHL